MATGGIAKLVSVSGALVPDNATDGFGSAAIAGAVVAVVVLMIVAALLRERHHQRRRKLLESQLSDLERILVSLSKQRPQEAPGRENETGTESCSASVSGELRGPLSTAISTLRHDLGPELPGPDRVDLRATLYVYEGVERPITPAELADGLNLSLRTVQRGLSGSLGCTPSELILAIKMREAKRMLTDGGCQVQEAARAVGYDDPFHFSRRFKAYYGVSPREMQDRINRNVA